MIRRLMNLLDQRHEIELLHAKLAEAHAVRDRMRRTADLNQRSREASNARNEALRRDLSALLTGDDSPLTHEDIVARVKAVADQRDARIPTDFDGAKAWLEARRWRFVEWAGEERHWWSSYEHGGHMGSNNTLASVVSAALSDVLRDEWEADA